MNFIADSGFIVARWSKSPARRQWAIEKWEEAALPMLTSAANLQEAGWLLDNHEIVLRMVKDGDLNPVLDFEKESLRLTNSHKLITPRINAPSAAIVRLSEIFPACLVLTTDREDFEVYRRNRRQIIPCDFGTRISLRSPPANSSRPGPARIFYSSVPHAP